MSLIEQLYKELDRLKEALFMGHLYSYKESIEMHPDNIIFDGINRFNYLGQEYSITKDINGFLMLRVHYSFFGWVVLDDEDVEKVINRMKKDGALTSVPTGITVHKVSSTIDGDFLLWFEIEEGKFNTTVYDSNKELYQVDVFNQGQLDSLIKFYSREK